MAESYSVKAILSAVDKGFTSTFSKAERLVERISSQCEKSTSSTAKLTSGFKSMAAAIGVTQAVGAAFDLLSGSIDSAVSRYDTLNRFPKVLQQIGFTAEDSQKSMEELSKGIQGLPTTLDDVVSTTQRLASMTGDLDKATKTTLALNDAFIASGSSSEDASRGLTQYVQMLAKGQVDLESWRSLQETMSVALNDVAKAFGFAGASAQNDLYEALKEGQITFDEFNAKLIELDGGVNGFAARAKTASGGIATAFINMRTAVTRGVTGIIKSVDKALQANGLPKIEEIVNNIGSTAETALGKVSGFIDSFAGAGNAASQFEALRNAIEPLVPLLAFLGSGAALSGILPVIGKTRSGMESLMDSAGNAAVKIGNAKDTAVLFGKAMSGSLAPGTEEFKNLGIESQRLVERVSGVKSVLSGSMDFESKGFKNLSKDTQNFLLQVDGMNQKFRGVASTLKSFGQSAVSMIPDSLLGRINGIKDGISGLASGITGKVSSLVSGVTGQFSKLTSFIPDSVKNIASGIGNGFKNISSVIGSSLKGSAQVGVAALQNMTKALSVVFKAALLSVGPAAILGLVVVGLGLVNQQFGQQINQLLTIAQQQGPQIITNLVAGIVNQIPQLASTGSMLLSQILTTIASLLPSITTAGINILNALISGVTGNMDVLIQGVMTLVGAIASSIIQLAPQIMLAGLNILMSLTQGILNNMPVILTGIQSLFSQMTNAISTWLPVMITYGIQILSNLADGIVQALPTLILCAIQLMTEFVSTINQNAGKMLDSAAEIVGKLVKGISSHLPEILSAALELVTTILDGIADNLPKIIQAGIEIVGSLASGVIKAIPDILSAAIELVGRLKDQFFETDWLSIGVNIISVLPVVSAVQQGSYGTLQSLLWGISKIKSWDSSVSILPHVGENMSVKCWIMVLQAV